MYDYSILPASIAETTIVPLLVDDKIMYTFMENMDEGQLYADLNERLMILEIALKIDVEALQSIIEHTRDFHFRVDEKEEVSMRIGWLQRLNKVQQELGDVKTIDEAQRLKIFISPCQTSPLKIQLITQLEQLAQSLPSEETEPIQMTDAVVLMEKAIEEAGDAFINLGKAGRDSVIADVLKQSGSKATIEAVHEHTKALEQRMLSLTAIKKSRELIKQLDSLPIPSFHALLAERKDRIAETLLENDKWNGLASLDRMVAHLDKAITNEEQQLREAENTMLSSDGKAALTLDIKNVVDGRIQLG